MPLKNNNSYRFTQSSITLNAPEKSGVYALYDSKRWFYIGESNNIRRRLLEHYSGDNACINRLKPTSFSFELVPANTRVQRQNQLIRELKPACNQMLG